MDSTALIQWMVTLVALIGSGYSIYSATRNNRKTDADTYSALNDSIEDLALENRTLRRENNKLRTQLRANGIEPANGEK